MTKTKVKFVVFDLDGTLVDSMGGFTRLAQEVLSRYFPISFEEAGQAYRRTSGLPFEFQVQELFPGHIKTKEAVDEFETRKKTNYDEKPFFPDVRPTLFELRKRGIAFAVSSNNFAENVSRKMQALGIDFDEILGYRPGFFKGKDHFDFLKTKYKLKSPQILFAGDSLHDAKKSFENQISFVARLGTFTLQDFEKSGWPFYPVKGFLEMLKYLEE